MREGGREKERERKKEGGGEKEKGREREGGREGGGESDEHTSGNLVSRRVRC